jgi:VanZ family protein
LGKVLIVYWLIMFTATHVPLPAHDLPRHSDKTVHLFGYFVLAILWILWRSAQGDSGWRRDLRCLSVIGCYAVLDEILQYPVGRTPDILDIAADCLGAALGVGIGTLVCRGRFAQRLKSAE